MRYIQKKPSPQAFEDWKQTNAPTQWSDLQNEPRHPEEGIVYYSKRELREALLIEQGHLCCYCQRRIENTIDTVLEHWFPRNGADKKKGKDHQFDYQNLMAACNGGERENQNRPAGTKPHPLWCDKNKKEQIISLSPLQKDIELRLTYDQVSPDEIRILPANNHDPDVHSTLKILNLNTPYLEKRRGEAVLGLIFKDIEMKEVVSPAEAGILLADLEQKMYELSGDYLPEFCSVKLHFLRLLSGRT